MTAKQALWIAAAAGCFLLAAVSGSLIQDWFGPSSGSKAFGSSMTAGAALIGLVIVIKQVQPAINTRVADVARREKPVYLILGCAVVVVAFVLIRLFS